MFYLGVYQYPDDSLWWIQWDHQASKKTGTHVVADKAVPPFGGVMVEMALGVPILVGSLFLTLCQKYQILLVFTASAKVF